MNNVTHKIKSKILFATMHINTLNSNNLEYTDVETESTDFATRYSCQG